MSLVLMMFSINQTQHIKNYKTAVYANKNDAIGKLHDWHARLFRTDLYKFVIL